MAIVFKQIFMIYFIFYRILIGSPNTNDKPSNYINTNFIRSIEVQNVDTLTSRLIFLEEMRELA